jgi:hypothetical protein
MVSGEVMQQHRALGSVGDGQPAAREDKATERATHMFPSVYRSLIACHTSSSSSWLGAIRRSYATAFKCSISAFDSRTVHCCTSLRSDAGGAGITGGVVGTGGAGGAGATGDAGVVVVTGAQVPWVMQAARVAPAPVLRPAPARGDP